MLENYTEQTSLKEENDKIIDLLNTPDDPNLINKIKNLEDKINKLKELDLIGTSTFIRYVDELNELNSRVKIKSNKQLILELIDNLNCQLSAVMVSNEYFSANFAEKSDFLTNYTGELSEVTIDNLFKLKKFIEKYHSIDYLEVLNKNEDLLGDTYISKTTFFYVIVSEQLIIFQYFPLGVIIYL